MTKKKGAAATITTTTTTTTAAAVGTSKKRKRTDTFWACTDDDNGQFFDSIYEGTSDVYYLDVGEVKEYNGRSKYCWQMYSRKTNGAVDTVRSTKTYRLAVVWSVYTKPEFWHHKSRLLRLSTKLPSIKTKRGDHSRHRCGNDWCCNPRHINIGTRADNEADKHFHYFLNHDDPSVRERFVKTFPDLMKRQGVW